MPNVETYGNGNWLTYQNANAKVTENKKHGVATNYQSENATAYNAFDTLLNDDNNNSNVTIFVSDRTEKNDKGKALAGLSYDLADMFMKAAANGLICDKDGKGFTRDDAEALGKMIAELDNKGENYMDDTFRSMGAAKKPKDRRTYTRAEIFTLMEAAGYTREKAPKQESQSEQTQNLEQKTISQPAQQPQPVPVKDKEKVAVTGKLTTRQLVDNGLHQAGLVRNGDDVCIDFKGKLNPDETGNYVKKGSFKYKAVALTEEDKKNNLTAHNLPDSQANEVKYKVKDGKLFFSVKGVHRSGNIFHKRQWMEVGPVDYTPNQEAAQEVEGAK